MYRKLILALPLVVATMLALSGTARAACPVDDPDCGGPGDPEPITKTLHVADSSQATLTAPGINCGVAGDDCTESYTYDFDAEPPSVTLTASGVPAGYTARLFKCTTTLGSSCVGGGSGTECGVGSCTFDMDANYLVRLQVADETAPSTATVSGPDKVGPSVRHFTAGATDGAGVVSYRFYLDGVNQGLSGPGSGFDVPVDTLSEGSHTVTARGRDAAGNESVSDSPDKTFTVDKSTAATGVSTPPAYTKTVPDITFGVPADVAGVVCSTTGGAGGSTPGCTSPYTPQGITTDGQYTITITVTDDVGNSAPVTRSFTLDRGAPNLTVTKPANGDVIGGPFTPTVSADDGFSSVTFSCKLDSGAFGSCTSLAPADGAHTVTVRASDAAGNTSEEQRSFTYDSHVPVVSITGGPGEGTVVYARSTAFTFTTSDLTAVTRSCKLDGGAFAPCTSATGHSLSGLSLGIHAFTLRVVDAAGNTMTVVRRFTVADKPAGGGGGGGTGGTGGSGGGTSGPTVKAARVNTFWRLFGKRTQVGTLTLTGAPQGAKVTITCKGKGCAFKKAKLTARGGKIKLAKRFKKRKLAAKTVITITVADASGTKRFRYALRAGKFPKKSIT